MRLEHYNNTILTHTQTKKELLNESNNACSQKGKRYRIDFASMDGYPGNEGRALIIIQYYANTQTKKELLNEFNYA